LVGYFDDCWGLRKNQGWLMTDYQQFSLNQFNLSYINLLETIKIESIQMEVNA